MFCKRGNQVGADCFPPRRLARGLLQNESPGVYTVYVSRLGLVVWRRSAGKRKDAGSTPPLLPPASARLSLHNMWCMDTVSWLCPAQLINETLKWFTSLALLNAEINHYGGDSLIAVRYKLPLPSYCHTVNMSRLGLVVSGRTQVRRNVSARLSLQTPPRWPCG